MAVVAEVGWLSPQGDATDMTKSKTGIIAGTLALVSGAIVLGVMSRFGYEALGSKVCLIVSYSGLMFGAAVGVLTNAVAHASNTEVILIPVFVFLWFFLIFWAILSKMYGRVVP